MRYLITLLFVLLLAAPASAQTEGTVSFPKDLGVRVLTPVEVAEFQKLLDSNDETVRKVAEVALAINELMKNLSIDSERGKVIKDFGPPLMLEDPLGLATRWKGTSDGFARVSVEGAVKVAEASGCVSTPRDASGVLAPGPARLFMLQAQAVDTTFRRLLVFDTDADIKPEDIPVQHFVVPARTSGALDVPVPEIGIAFAKGIRVLLIEPDGSLTPAKKVLINACLQ